MANFWQTVIYCNHKIQWFPLSMLIFGQKSCFFGPTMFKILQPNWYLYGYGQKFTFRMQGAGVHAMTCFVPPSLLPTNFLFSQPELTMANFFKYCPKIGIMQLKKKKIYIYIYICTNKYIPTNKNGNREPISFYMTGTLWDGMISYLY